MHFTAEIGAKARGPGNKKGCGSGKETLRLRSKGVATVEKVILLIILHIHSYHHHHHVFIRTRQQ